MFVDFSKAYDRVLRKTLLSILKEMGCGFNMLRAIMLMYKITRNILNSTIIKATIRVKQGGPSSGVLFILYLDKLSKLLKKNVEDDDYL